MSDKNVAVATKATAVKRRSVLSELGIKPGGAEVITPSSTKKTIKPSSPSVSKTGSGTSSPSTTVRKKAPPASIKVVENAPTNSSINSPTSPNPRRRSIVPTTSNQRATISPLARRASVNLSNSTVANKRVSSPAGLESLEEVQSIKEQLSEKDEEIKRLKEIEAENVNKLTALETELEILRQELKVNQSQDSQDEDKLKQVQEKHHSDIEALLLEQEKKLDSLKTSLTLEHEKAIQLLKADYEQRIDAMMEDYDQQINTMVADHNFQIESLNDSHKAEKETLTASHHATVSDLNTQLQALEENQTNSHLRKVQNDLDTTLATFEEFKRNTLQETEALERRYRDEIRQLQTGNDDTTEVWLEKTRSAQQELGKLHDEIQSKEQEHKDFVQSLSNAHAEELDKLHELCDEKETQIEAQSNQIENLMYQVETLQNSLEAATVRLEHTAKSTPTTSSTREDINNPTPHEPIKNIHEECLNRVDAKQKEIEDILSRLADLKVTHEGQINRLGQEKANAIQDLKKQIATLEQKLADIAVTPPQSPTRVVPANIDSSNIEERLIRIAEQHRNELKKMHDQYQTVVDTKNNELEDYAYRIKAIVAAKQKDIEKIQIETNHAFDKYEQDIKNYEAKLVDFENESIKLKENASHWELLSKNNQALIEDMKKGCAAHTDENAQLLRLVDRLQSEIHG